MAFSGCCLTCIKYTLFVFNFLFWLVGCLLLSVGIWAAVEPQTFRDYTDGLEWKTGVLVYSMIAIGSVMAITGFLGCCGAIRGNRCLIISFFIFLFVINAVFVSVGMYLMIRRDKVSDWFERPEKEKIKQNLLETIRQIDLDPAMKTQMESIHSRYKCCGADKGRQDYAHLSTADIPNCSRSEPCTDAVLAAETRRYKIRMKKLTKFVIVISAVILGISAFMVVGLVLSIVLCCALKNELVETY